ncbi:hypothetical protein L9Z17_16510 [Leptospira noguchii]|nr:hypothetical protein [Leptospira noguchii]
MDTLTYNKLKYHEIARRGIIFELSDVKSYDQVIKEFAPSSLKIFLPQDPTYIRTWLNETVLELIEQYMGVRPFYSSWESKYYNIDKKLFYSLSERQKKYIPKSFIQKN